MLWVKKFFLGAIIFLFPLFSMQGSASAAAPLIEHNEFARALAPEELNDRATSFIDEMLKCLTMNNGMPCTFIQEALGGITIDLTQVAGKEKVKRLLLETCKAFMSKRMKSINEFLGLQTASRDRINVFLAWEYYHLIVMAAWSFIGLRDCESFEGDRDAYLDTHVFLTGNSIERRTFIAYIGQAYYRAMFQLYPYLKDFDSRNWGEWCQSWGGCARRIRTLGDLTLDEKYEVLKTARAFAQAVKDKVDGLLGELVGSSVT